MRSMHPTRLFSLALLLTIGLYGCTLVPTAEPPEPPPDRDALLEVLDLNAADLEGVDLDAIIGSLDASAIVEAVRASEREGEAAVGKNYLVRSGGSIQEAVDAAPVGGTVFVRPGTYEETVTITKSLHLVGLGRPGAVVIQDPGDGENGIFARGVSGLSLINLTVRGFSNNGVFFVDVDGYLLFRLVTDQLREGAYGLFPVRSRNGLIARCTATGADDAGIYVGQSENVAVVHNEAYGNVIGFEAENVKQNAWAYNYGYDNVAGMLAILLPPSRFISVLHAEELLVAHNRFTGNNGDNFAEEGELAAFVPSGSGLLVFGYDDSLIRRNHVTGNAYTGIGLGSTVTLWAAAGRDLADLAAIDPHPDDVQVIDNRVTGNGFGPPLALPGLPDAVPAVDLLWDKPVIDFLASVLPGFPFAAYGTGNCWEGNTYESSFPEDLPSCGTSD
ncbi:MAG: right-handed parallel beta-helix repeat-containing protein [Rhodothermales bacterium]